MKKIIAILALAAMLLTMNAAAYGAENAGTESEVAAAASGSADTGDGNTTTSGAIDAGMVIDLDKTYKIAELQEIAIGISRQALVDDVDIKKKEMSVRTVRSDINAMSDSILSITRPIEVVLESDAAKKTKQDHLNQLKVEVYKAAINIQLYGKEIALQEHKLDLAEERLELAKARFKASSITQEDLDSAQYNVESSRVNLTNVKEKLNSGYLELRKLLNQSLDSTPVKIANEIKLAAFEDIDIDGALQELFKTETSVYKASGKLDIAQTAMDIAAKLYRKGDRTYDNNVLNLEEAKLDLAGAKTALEVKVKNTYNDLSNKLDNVELAGKYTALAGKKLANAQVKYDKGTINKEAFMSIKESYLDAEYAELSAIVDFNGVIAELNNMLGLE